VTFGPIGKELLNKLQSKGIVGLAYWGQRFKQMSANKPLRKPEDVKGLKMRVQPSAVLQAQMRTLGAIPEVMDFSAAYQALKSGAVDGTENPASNFYSQQMQDVQKHLSVTHHGYVGYAVIVNRKFWEGLAGRYPRQSDRRPSGRDHFRERHRRRGQCRCAGCDRAQRQDAGDQACAAGAHRMEEALVAVHREMGEQDRQAPHRVDLQGDRV